MKMNCNRIDKLLRRSVKYKVIAFDVFGTLLYRDVGAPADLFRLMGPDFYEKRLRAEAEARASHSGEITLEEIYARPALAGYSPAGECGAELHAVVANEELLSFAKACQERGQSVYAVSDMYLPQEQIQAMLKRCGFDFLDGVFVSSAYGVQKRSGKLFRQFLRETSFAASEVLFLGDDLRADVMGAAVCGIRACLYRNPNHIGHPEVMSSWQGRALVAFEENRLQTCPNDRESVGYQVIGPILTAFTDWLHARRMAAPERPLLFLARDMYLVYQVYRAQYPEDENTAYLQVSRRSLCPRLLAAGNTELLRTALPRRKMSEAEIAAYCGADDAAVNQAHTFDLKATEPDEALQRFLAGLQPATGSASLLQYLHSIPVGEGAFLVDIGSGGTTQHLLESLLGLSLHGLYLACDERLHNVLPKARAEVFLFEGKPAPCTYWAGQPMLERLLSEENGSVTGYCSVNGTPEPLRAAKIAGPRVEEFQTGALRFVRDIRQSVLAAMKIPPQDAVAPFLRLVDVPTDAETELLGDVQIEDGASWPLAAPRPQSVYLHGEASFSKDFGAAPWKVGFMKRLLHWPLPYGAAYRLLKH